MEKECCCHKTKERDAKEYKDLCNRLSRIEGQIRGIKGMVEKDAYCSDILNQVSAAQSALYSFTKVLLDNHIKSCVVRDIKEGRASLKSEEGRLEELADTGARIQMNYSSIDGGWNNNTAQWCKRQLKDGLVHYLGTDMHNSGERSPQTEHVEKWLNKNLSEDYVWALIQGNARRILDDRGSHKPKT